MQPGNEEERRSLIHRADALERSLDQNQQSMIRTEHLMALIEEMASDLRQLAEEWDSIDPQRAERWRAQEQQARALGGEFAHLEELEASEAKAIIASLRHLVRRRPAAA
jgi:transposase